ncbi:MAG: DNA alkylation repair protein [Acidimicrobiia bacterium]|nr:DNA alkylation repair protein [Acidimicrobiia bacterium]
MDVAATVTALTGELTQQSTPERAEGEKRYLKSDLEFLGATIPTIRRTAKRFRRSSPDLDRADLISLVDGLWAKRVHELRMLGIELLALYDEVLKASDLPFIERLLRESKTWALVDTLCTRVVGGMVERFPELSAELDRWARDADFWIRRSALLAHLTALRAGEGDWDRFARIADGMLEEKEFFIRKAIGWVLRDTARRRPELVAGWVGPRTHRMSGITIREAVKPLPPQQADAFLDAYRERRPATV